MVTPALSEAEIFKPLCLLFVAELSTLSRAVNIPGLVLLLRCGGISWWQQQSGVVPLELERKMNELMVEGSQMPSADAGMGVQASPLATEILLLDTEGSDAAWLRGASSAPAPQQMAGVRFIQSRSA